MKNGTPTPASSHLDAVIIGAGFGGLYQLYCLRDRLGLSATVLEAADGVGGTWYWNRYPGARCDSESHGYCYTFSDELVRDWEWSERYPGQPEVLRYLNHVADRFDLRRDIRFETRVTAARFDEAEDLWRIETDCGVSYTARFLITAVGCLSSANIPDIPGLEDFEGDWYHTGEWPHEGVDFSGKRVGQVGTGSTGIQCAPVIAEDAAHLTVFQRTANYSVPAHNGPMDPTIREQVKERYHEIRETMHKSPNGHPFLISESKAVDTEPAEREALYEAAWQKGGLRFRAVFQDLLVDQTANDTASDFIKSKIRNTVQDPETSEILANIDHPFATKRPPIDTHYFETFNRPNVSLVDLRADPIERIVPTGIKTRTRTFDLDILVFATGFDAMTGTLLKIDIQGTGGRTLREAWKEGPRTYLGLQVDGFPNLFTVTGPGSPSVLTNMPVAIEQHVEWITDCIATMLERGATRVEPTAASVMQWGEHVNARAEETLMPKAGHSWYLGANVPGKPRVFMPYPGGMHNYREICEDVAAKGYEGFVIR